MRPQSIVWFERIMLGSYLVGLISTVLHWNDTTAMLEAGGSRSPAFFAFLTAGFSLALPLTLTLLISRRRSKVAMWVSLAMFVLGLPLVLAVLASDQAVGSPYLTLAITLSHVFAYGLLFSPSASLWLKRGPQVSPDIFR